MAIATAVVKRDAPARRHLDIDVIPPSALDDIVAT
jgi:hypothetical protein